MQPIALRDAQKLSAPNPFALVVTADQEGKPNLMALSWWTYVANNPPIIAACLSNRGYSGELIAQSGEFSLCLPDETLKEAAFLCGTCSGREVDKAGKFGIELTPSAVIRPMLVKRSCAAMECRLESAVPAGDHTIYIARVEAAYAGESKKHLMAVDGYARLEAF